MKINMGSWDRGLRSLVALFVIIFYFMGVINGTLAVVLLAFSFIFLLTSAFGVCPLYSFFGVSTCPTKQ